MIRTPHRWVLTSLAWGYAILAASCVLLFGFAEIQFARHYPDYHLTEGWPTVSRALAHADPSIVDPLALVAALGLLFGAVASFVTFRLLVRGRQMGLMHALAYPAIAVCAALLALPLYLMVTITLSDDNHGHMMASYAFFFGMSIVILADLVLMRTVSDRVHGLPRPDAMAVVRVLSVQRVSAWAVIIVALLFLTFYVLKGVPAIPVPVRALCQKIFVVMELLWIALALTHAVTHQFLVRACLTPAAADAAPALAGLHSKGVQS